MPYILVSCKCDESPDCRQLDPRIIEQIETSFGPGRGAIDCFQTSANVPDGHKRCISVILRSIVSGRSGSSCFSSSCLVTLELLVMVMVMDRPPCGKGLACLCEFSTKNGYRHLKLLSLYSRDEF